MADPEAMPDPVTARLRCPRCDEEVDVAADLAGQLVKCPYCSTDFFASTEQSHEIVVDDTTPTITDTDREAAFDKLRIENYTALRMGAIRARSWWLIALSMALLIVLDMVGKAIIFVLVFHQITVNPCLRIAFAIVGSIFARYAWRRAKAFKVEIDRSAIADPITPPDFSTLDNGSERWKHLDNVR